MSSRVAFLAGTLLLVLAGALAAAQPAAGSAQDVRRLLDSGEPEQALALCQKLEESGTGLSAELLLLRSEARFALADPLGGRADLEQALKRDPELRQGYLYLGALEIAQQNWDAAVAAFERARQLDPSAGDNSLNLGAALLFAGRLDDAVAQFDRHLAADPSVEALLLVAKNYSVGGQPERALDLLERAVAREEIVRVRIRTDPSFDRLLPEVRMQELLETDRAVIPTDHHRTFFRLPEVTYEIERGRALSAVIDAVRRRGLTVDPRIEVTTNWSLLHGDVRIRVGPDLEKGGSRVDLSAAPDAYSRDQFVELSRDLYGRVQDELADDALPLARRP